MDVEPNGAAEGSIKIAALKPRLRRTERETGIPRGLPYLTGFVAHCEIQAESAG
jgi:hypothetical protein